MVNDSNSQQVRDRDSAVAASAVLWNAFSLGCLAIGGIGVNLLISYTNGPDYLGVFAQGLAAFLLFGQFAAFGIQWSVLQAVSAKRDDPSQLTGSLRAGLAAVSITGAIVAAIVYLIATPIGTLFESDELGRGLVILAPGVFCFALNKVLLNALNSQDRQGAFSGLRSLRALLVIAIAALIALAGDPDPSRFLWALTLSEAVLLVAAFIASHRTLTGPTANPIQASDVFDHLRFGLKALPSGAANDLTIRVDIIVLGFFLTDATVGQYALIAMVIEGMMAAMNVVKFVLNPKLRPLMDRNDRPALQSILRRWVGWSYLVAAGLLVLALPTYGLLFVLGLAGPLAEPQWPPLIVVAGGFLISAGLRPIDLIFNQAAQPLLQSRLRVSVLAMNVAGNALLIPLFGMLGAAIGTAVAFTFGAGLTWWLMRSRLDIQLG